MQHNKTKKQQLATLLLETLFPLASRIPHSNAFFYFSYHSSVFAFPPLPKLKMLAFGSSLLGPPHEFHKTCPKLNLRFLLRFIAVPVFPISVSRPSSLLVAQTTKVIFDSFFYTSLPSPINSTFFLSLFIHFERDRDSTSEGGSERGRERIPSKLPAVNTDPEAGLKLTKP